MDADPLAWADLVAIADEVATAVALDRTPDVLVGVLRGGMIPAVLLAHRLGVRDVRAVTITHTETDGVNAAKTSQPVLANAGSLGDLRGLDVLIVDDIVGTGDTLVAARNQVCLRQAASIRSAVCLLNQANWPAGDDAASPLLERTPTYLGRRTRRWVVFPWERS